jgi:hypothetical protein
MDIQPVTHAVAQSAEIVRELRGPGGHRPASPSHSHRGRRPAEVDEFLVEGLRLGHTKRGSFVVTAAARFDRADIADGAAAEQGQITSESVDSSGEPEADSGVDVYMPPFARRVMTTFSRGLEAARAVATDTEPVLTAIENGLSLELAEALEKISNEEGLQTIEVSFDWSDAVPAPPKSVPETIRFDRRVLDSLPRVTEQLQVRQQPVQVTLMGQVTALSRNLADEEVAESGEVTVFGEVEGHARKVLVILEGEAHEYAIRAYRDRFPIVVSGEIVKRRSWHLEGHVEMDLETARLMANRSVPSSPTQNAIEPPPAEGSP